MTTGMKNSKCDNISRILIIKIQV